MTTAAPVSAAEVVAFVQPNPFSSDLEIAAFARLPTTAAAGAHRGFFISVTNPWGRHVIATNGPDPADSVCVSGRNHVGDDLPGMPVGAATPRMCADKCTLAGPTCAGFVWLPSGCEGHETAACYLKHTVAAPSQEACSCLGVKPFAPPPPPPQGVEIDLMIILITYAMLLCSS